MKEQKRDIPIIILFILGTWMILEYYVPLPAIAIVAAKDLRNFANLIAAGSYGLGVAILCLYHGRRVVMQMAAPHWLYSAIFFVGLIATVIPGLYGGMKEPHFLWIYSNLYSPIGVALYSTTAFFITSAGLRVFRARNIDAGILLVTGSLVLMTMMPLITAVIPGVINIGTWLQSVPGGAGFRGFIIGVALGIIGLGVRILTGRHKEVLG